mmetsp:Transcript_92152/g.214156  ORF Transcript_92152/g.214156 Transcript_92152/m.214156 type:complete len:129 (+) Transcript_92152:71-457(+)
MVETIPQYVVEEDEGVVFYMGAHAYVPRLVQANIPWQRPAVPSLKYSTKRDSGGSLKTLGADTYAPSGIPLKPEDLLPGPKPTQTKRITVGSLGGAKQVWKEGAFKGVPDSKEPLKSLVEMLEKKPKS